MPAQESSPQPIHAILVHGLGRTPCSMALLAWRLRRLGVRTRLFGYHAAVEPFERTVQRLRSKMQSIPEGAPWIAIGHSLGGLLLRAAISQLPAEGLPRHLFMLATPSSPATIACRLRQWLPYRFYNGDAGQMLACSDRMGAIPPPPPQVPATIVAGTVGLPAFRRSPFGELPNDAIVTVEETRLPVECPHVEHVCVPATHTFIMNRREVLELVYRKLGELKGAAQPNGSAAQG